MNRAFITKMAIALWVVAAVPVVQQTREALLVRSFQSEWQQYYEFDLPQRFAGHLVETLETDRNAMEAMVSVGVDGNVVLPPARLRINRDTGNITRYHRWISQSRFRSQVRSDSVMLLGRLRVHNGEQVFDLLTIDKDGGVAVEADIRSVFDGSLLKYRVLSQLDDETPPVLPYSEWSVFYVLGGGFLFGVFLSVMGPWIALVLSSVVLVVVATQHVRRRTRTAVISRSKLHRSSS